MKIELSLKELHTISNALRVAAIEYEDDARTAAKYQNARVTQQFQEQAREARSLADKIDEHGDDY